MKDTIRHTLEKYYSYTVKVKGIYMGAARGHKIPVPLHPTYMIPENALLKGLIKAVPNMLNSSDNTRLLDTTETSLLINVRGIDGFEDINEDHVIIQGKVDAITETTVSLQGTVYCYTRKDGKSDYGIALTPPGARVI